ncbi:MAG: carbohydrate ABC transporter permease [Chloroflexi bacterium]|nr:carbohydrate ABC transporter permease [Chloroflexota bacterium]MBV9893710.1 carbohydrate ABC transporter permease [Chloroflexota bacterium]
MARSVALWLQYAVCILATLIIGLPLVTTVLGGFKSTAQLQSQPFGWPNPVHAENYVNVLANSSFWQQLANSVLVTGVTVVLILISATAAAFVFARMAFRGRDFLFNMFTIGLLFPLPVAILPLFIQLRQLGLIDTLLGVALPQVAFNLSISVLILRSFFRAVPGELEDAAYIDGCGAIGFLLRVLVPLSVPALAIVAVLAMVNSWNQFLLPLVVINSERLFTLPLGVMQFQGQYGTDIALVMAFVVLAMIPAVVFYLFAERYLVAGLTAGAIKE